jgi:hypothetical protein
MAKFTSTEAKNPASLSKEPKPQTGTVRGKMGIGVFGSARFGETTGRDWNKEGKVAESLTKEPKP